MAGKLNLVSYDIERKSLVLVSVNNTPVPDENQAKTQLNNIFVKAPLKVVTIKNGD